MTDTPHKNRSFLLAGLLLAVVTLAVFWQVTDHEFINYDDTQYVAKNPQVQGGLTLGGIRWAFTTSHAGYWHPLTWLSHMLDYQLFGLQASWHHLMNLFFHLANTLLLFVVLRRMTRGLWQSAFVSALFALHPLHVESVAWVAERKDVLSAFFWILTMGAYARYVERRGIRRYLPVLVFFILGLMSKPMVVTVPFVLLLLDYWPLGRLQPAEYASVSGRMNQGRKKRKGGKGLAKEAAQVKPSGFSYEWPVIRALVWEKAPFFAFTVVSSVITFYHQQKEGAMQALPLDARIGNALVSYVSYVVKMIWPRDLAIFYPHPGAQPLWEVFGSALVLVIITVVVIGGVKRFPYLAFGWF
ncbi:MAG: glycosyltransferase family 39 protein, partial [Deltaproteobacteria bacterium]|nr:glycosyltransferase family 39 protein [Deltaproteobacteria bacterium]